MSTIDDAPPTTGWRTGFCEVGNHHICRHTLVTPARTLVCSCGCHTPPPEPVAADPAPAAPAPAAGRREDLVVAVPWAELRVLLVHAIAAGTYIARPAAEQRLLVAAARRADRAAAGMATWAQQMRGSRLWSRCRAGACIIRVPAGVRLCPHHGGPTAPRLPTTVVQLHRQPFREPDEDDRCDACGRHGEIGLCTACERAARG